VPELWYSPMRAERAKRKSCKDDEIIAQGKRSAALGYGGEMIHSFFPSGLARQGRARPEGKEEDGWNGSLPRAAASTALPWAIILLPLRGAGKANQRAALGGGGFPRAMAWAAWPRAGRWLPCWGVGEANLSVKRMAEPAWLSPFGGRGGASHRSPRCMMALRWSGGGRWLCWATHC
jgi:hypothetical protein